MLNLTRTSIDQAGSEPTFKALIYNEIIRYKFQIVNNSDRKHT